MSAASSVPSGAAWLAAAAFVVAAVVAALASRLLAARASAAWHDLPNRRSLHAAPVPRVGGLGLHAGWLTAAAATTAAGVAPPVGGLPGWGAALGLAAVFAISLLDDRRSIGPLPRLGVQAAAAALLVAGVGTAAVRRAWPAAAGPAAAAAGLPLESAVPWAASAALALGCAVALLAVLWAMNLYNFMDGADGLAGGMALFGFGTYAWVAIVAAGAEGALPAGDLAVLAAAVAGAAAGFLALNFPPARVFLGDAGSVPLGFLAAAIGLAGIARGAWGWWLPPLAFLPFATDATFTLAQRALRGERVWQAHREHGYQKLILMGWSHRRCALAWYAAMGACAAAAAALAQKTASVQWSGLALMAACALCLRLAIEAAWRRRVPEPSR